MKPYILLWFVFTIGQAQTLVESSIAAAGGSVAGVAGKKVSEGIDKVFVKVTEISNAAAAAAIAEDKKTTRSLPQQPGIPRATAPLPRTGATRPAARPAPQASRNVAATRRPSNLDTTEVYLEPPAPPPAPEVPQPTVADLQALSKGTTRDELAGRMGKPSAKLTMAADGKLVELYTYRNAGSVRLEDGIVVDVRPAQ